MIQVNKNNYLTPLPTLDSYSETQIQEFTEYSTVSKLYFNILQNTDIDEVYKIRHTCWLEVALSNYFNTSNQQIRSYYWSKCMDKIVEKIFNLYFDKDDKVMILALGKYGSQVLNLSSDIDIIILTDQTISNELLKKVRLFIQHLNSKSHFGFLTRVDLDLKPSDQTGPIINATQLMNYLWNSSELWERLVYTRARKICGQLQDEIRLLQEINKFCYRKYIRLDLVENLSDLLIKILSNNYDPSNIKLCPGGIRSIELLLSAIQLLYGGRAQELQTSYTYNVFEKLNDLQILKIDQADLLLKNYNFLRAAEDKVQMILDTQTHTVSKMSGIDNMLVENTQIIDSFLKTLFKKNNSATSDLILTLKELSKKHLHLEDFLKFLNKHSSYVKLFDSHPKSYKNLLKALIYSPQVTKLILLRPDLLDMFLIQKEHFSLEMNDEDFLISLSDFKSISQISAIGEFLTNFDLNKLLLKNSKTADFCVNQILDYIFKDEKIDILKLGKWSSNELGIFSDLDFVFVYNEEKDLSRQSRKFISYLTHSTFHGSFYSIDLRLRPNSSAGPILTSEKKLISNLESTVPVWLKQSYLRNLYLKSQTTLSFNISRPNASEISELKNIREKRLFKPVENMISIKENFGGLIDIEFFIQCLFLDAGFKPEKNSLKEQIIELTEKNLLKAEVGLMLRNNYELLRLIEQTSEILFKSSKISAAQFQNVFQLLSDKLSLSNLNKFEDLEMIMAKIKTVIENNHPFLK